MVSLETGNSDLKITLVFACDSKSFVVSASAFRKMTNLNRVALLFPPGCDHVSLRKSLVSEAGEPWRWASHRTPYIANASLNGLHPELVLWPLSGPMYLSSVA